MSLLNIAQLITNSLRVDSPEFNFKDDIDWPQLAHHADGHSLTPLLYDTWRRGGVLNNVPEDICQRMAQAYADNARRNAHIRREVLEIHQILTAAEVPHLLLKGWSLIEQLYADAAQRVLYDHDFLVPPDRAETGHQALQAAGYQPLPGQDGWVEKHLQPLWRNNGYHWDGYLFDPLYPRPVELHVTLWDKGWRGLRVDTLSNPWANIQTCPVAGVPMQTLSSENTLIHLAMHFAGHLVEREARLNQLLDLARFMAAANGVQSEALPGEALDDEALNKDPKHSFGLQFELNWEQVLSQALQVNIGRFVYASLYLAHRIFGSPLPPAPVWQQFAKAAPAAFRNWLALHGPTDVLTSDYRRIEKGKDYQLTFLAAASLIERLGIVRFAALPPVGQLMAKYNFRHRWLGPVFYPRHVFDRIKAYGKGVLSKE